MITDDFEVKLESTIQWEIWEIEILGHLGNIVGAVGTALSYVIRQNSVPNHIDQLILSNTSVDFTACLKYQRTNIFLNTWFPTQADLDAFPHIKLTSCQPWNPHQIEFPSTKYYVKEEIEAQNVSSIGIIFHQSIEDDELQIVDEEDIILSTQCFSQRLVASVRISGKQEISIESATR